jgi:solute carrier family 13 (sodium-dependent dicarboxylate transporter), member 2/3/5
MPNTLNLSINTATRAKASLSSNTARYVLTTLIGAAGFGALSMAADLPTPAKVALGTFLMAIVAWTVLDLDETPVALASVLGLLAGSAIKSDKLFSSLGDDLIWLLIGGFVIAAVLKLSGVADWLVQRALGRAGTFHGLCIRMTWIVFATAFIIPSTSARAALMLPVFLVLAAHLPTAAHVKALALIMVSGVLLSACASLLGAGAHVVAVDFMHGLTGNAPDYLQWLIWGAPFALLTSFAASYLAIFLFVPAADRNAPVRLPNNSAHALSRQQRTVLVLTLGTVALWCLGELHGVPPAVVAVGAMVVMTCPAVTGVTMKSALKHVEWNIILFLAATMVMGHALVDTSAAAWIAQHGRAALPVWMTSSPIAVVTVVSALALTSHLVVTSRTARATVIIPAVVLPLASGVNPALLVFLATVASGFCQTLSVSAKPVALFMSQETPPYRQIDLMRLSAALMPVMLTLLVFFGMWVWPALGLRLT